MVGCTHLDHSGQVRHAFKIIGSEFNLSSCLNFTLFSSNFSTEFGLDIGMTGYFEQDPSKGRGRCLMASEENCSITVQGL